MARFNVGEAFLQVVASVKGIHEAISAEVAKIKDIQIDVTPNLTGFREKIAAEVAGIADVEIDVTPNLTGFREKVAAETARLADVDVNVKPDTTGFREKVKAAVAGVGSMDVPVSPNVDTTRADAQVGAFATRVKTKLDAAIKSISDFRFGADQSEIDRAIAAIRAKLVTLSQMVIKPGMDSSQIVAEAAKLEAQLKTLLADKTINIKTKTDINEATVALTTLRKSFSDTERDGNLVSRAFGGLVSAIGSGISSLGSFVGSASSVGSALTSMGGSVTGTAGSFASLGQNIGSVLSSALPFLATAAQWTAMGIAIAGAGAIAVGGIGQLGGAVVALASGIVPLVTSLGLLPGLLAPLGIGLATLAIGFDNAGTKGKSFKDAMAQLKTAFQPVIDSIHSQMQPAIQTFIKSVSSLAPVIQSVVPQITSAVSQVTNSFSAMFRSSSFQSDLKTLLSGAAQNIKVFGDAAKNAFQGFMNIMVAAQPAVNRIATDIDQAAQKFNQWTAAARQSGELTTIFQQAATVLEQLGNTVVNIAGLFKDLWDSANRTGAFTATLSAINTGITQFRDYVTQAGGAWDQLMSKAGAVTTSLVGLVGSIGNAFVTLGNSIDISGVIDTITAAINNMTPAFAQIGAAATPVFENIITIIGRMVQALGPSVSEAFNTLGTAIQSIDWESVTVGVATFIKGMSDIVATITTVGEAFQTFEQMINQVMSGDFAGAGQSLDHLGQLWADLGTKLTDTSSIEAARTSVSGLNAEIQGVQQPTPVIFNADGSQVQTTTGQVQGWIAGVSADWDTKFTGDASGVQGAAGQANAAARSVTPDWLTKFTGDAGALVGAATQGQAATQSVTPEHNTQFIGVLDQLNNSANSATTVIGGVVQSWLTSFLGDAGGVQGAAGQATGAITGVPADHFTTLTGDASSLVAGAGQASSSIAAVPADHNTTINASDLASGAAATATGAIGSVPESHDTSINADDQATGVIDSIISALNAIPTFIQTVVQTVYQSVGGAGGMIATPMAAGGVLGMARGGALRPNMSGSAAKIVPPNTWRVIGDRLVDDEAFIPINNSVSSTAILAETANRKGFALTPMAGGGFSSQDGRAWDWLEELLHRHHGGDGSGTPPSAQQAVPLYEMFSHLATRNIGFGTGNTAAVTAMARGYRAMGQYSLGNVDFPPVPSGGGGSGGGQPPPAVVHVHFDGSRMDDLGRSVMTFLRNGIRVEGGNVQDVLGAR